MAVLRPPRHRPEAAVLADPVSVSLRSILLAPPASGQAVLVYGSGTLAFAAIALLRHLYPDVEVWAATRPGARAALATRLGAHAVLSCSPEELVAQVARRAGATPLSPWSKHDWLQDGPAVVYDTIGSVETVETSLRLLTTGGTLVVSGVEPPKRFEWTPLHERGLEDVDRLLAIVPRGPHAATARCRWYAVRSRYHRRLLIGTIQAQLSAAALHARLPFTESAAPWILVSPASLIPHTRTIRKEIIVEDSGFGEDLGVYGAPNPP